MKKIRVLTVIYNVPIQEREVVLFRGAVLNKLGEQSSVLFHNHTGDDTFRYAYPLIQYKRLDGKAAIVCVEEGIEQVGQVLTKLSGTIRLGERVTSCEVERVIPAEESIDISEQYATYRLNYWLPLNGKNYKEYLETESMVEKIALLERILAGNLLSFLKGINIRLEQHFDLTITEMLNQRIIVYKGVKLMSFEVKFKTNISLPSNIGIGKNASIGCGVLLKITN